MYKKLQKIFADVFIDICYDNELVKLFVALLDYVKAKEGEKKVLNDDRS